MGLGANFTNAATASMGNVNLNPQSQAHFLKAASKKKTGTTEETKTDTVGLDSINLS